MDFTIALILLQDGIVNGAIYALLGLALVLVFAVTRVIFIPQGEFVAFGALTLAMLIENKTPGTMWLLPLAGSVVFLMELRDTLRTQDWRKLFKTACLYVLLPVVMLWVIPQLAAAKLPLWVDVLISMAMVIPLGPMLYRIAYQPLAEASVLVLLIVSVAVHFALTGLALVFFGALHLRHRARDHVIAGEFEGERAAHLSVINQRFQRGIIAGVDRINKIIDLRL
jgi:branched-chain amino acid transport system permease protein